jgi:hypothetical protein
MTAISSNLICVEPSVDALVAGLRDAVFTVGDLDRRVRGSSVDWSADWDVSLNDDLLRRLLTALGSERLISQGTDLGSA